MEVCFYVKHKNRSKKVWSEVVGVLMDKDIYPLGVPTGGISHAPPEVKPMLEYLPKLWIHDFYLDHHRCG